MNHKLSLEDQKQIAHFIAQRSLATVGTDAPTQSADKYIQTFNTVINITEKYNKTIKD